MRAGTAVAATLRHAVGVGVQAALIAAIAAALAFAAATVSGGPPAGADSVLAAKGGNGGTTESWIGLATVSGFAVTGPSLGATVTFAATYPSSTKNPRVEVLCYQQSDPSGLAQYDPARGYLVYGETGDIGQALGDGTSPLGYNGFLLGGGMSAWLLNGGSADCVANLFYFGQRAGTQTFNVLASTSFAAP